MQTVKARMTSACTRYAHSKLVPHVPSNLVWGGRRNVLNGGSVNKSTPTSTSDHFTPYSSNIVRRGCFSAGHTSKRTIFTASGTCAHAHVEAPDSGPGSVTHLDPRDLSAPLRGLLCPSSEPANCKYGVSMLNKDYPGPD